MAYRAHMNALESLAVFAPLALAVSGCGSSNQVTAAASAVVFVTRLIHAPAYIMNVPVIRTVLVIWRPDTPMAPLTEHTMTLSVTDPNLSASWVATGE